MNHCSASQEDTLGLQYHPLNTQRSMCNRAARALVIPDGVLRSGAVSAAPARINRDAVDALHAAADVVVVPHLREDGLAAVEGAAAGLGLVVAGAGAADVGGLAEAAAQGALDVGHRVRGAVRRVDAAVREPAPGGEGLVVRRHRREEVDHLLVRRVARPVALRVEGAEARRVLAELVRPENPAWLVETCPVPVWEGGVLVMCEGMAVLVWILEIG